MFSRHAIGVRQRLVSWFLDHCEYMTMSREIPDAELEAYLDEALPPDRMLSIEDTLREESELAGRLAAVNGRRDAGIHTLGEIWRRNRLSCATREELGSMLLGALDEELADYLKFHLNVIGCRYCQANLDDLTAQQAEAQGAEGDTRRRKYFQTSAEYLNRS